MDEPIAGLDPMGRENFMQLTKSLNECGITILMVSHNMDNLAEYTKKVLVMNEGELLMEGTPAEIFSDYEKLKAASLDLPEVAPVSYTHLDVYKRQIFSSTAGLFRVFALESPLRIIFPEFLAS